MVRTSLAEDAQDRSTVSKSSMRELSWKRTLLAPRQGSDCTMVAAVVNVTVYDPRISSLAPCSNWTQSDLGRRIPNLTLRRDASLGIRIGPGQAIM
jgi:hypothetical protein